MHALFSGCKFLYTEVGRQMHMYILVMLFKSFIFCSFNQSYPEIHILKSSIICRKKILMTIYQKMENLGINLQKYE